MTENELTLFTEAVLWYKRWEDCNPDVGMGPRLDTLINYITRRTGFVPNDAEKQIIKNKVEH